jgi:hypothetical protein
MTLSPNDRGILGAIRSHGWAIQGVGFGTCDHHPGHGSGPTHVHDTGDNAYQYTVGLTEAGLPELLLRMPGRGSPDWAKAGCRILNAVAAHTLHQELTVGEVLEVATVGGRSITVAEAPPPSRDHGGIWPGAVQRIYGRLPRMLEILVDW